MYCDVDEVETMLSEKTQQSHASEVHTEVYTGSNECGLKLGISMMG